MAREVILRMLLHLPIWQHLAYVFMAEASGHRLEDALLGEHPGDPPRAERSTVRHTPGESMHAYGRPTQAWRATRSRSGVSRRRENE